MGNRVLSVHQEHELLLKLEQAGLSEPDAQAVVQSRGNVLAKKIVGLIRGIKVAAIEGDWFSFTTTGRSVREQQELYPEITIGLSERDPVLGQKGPAGRRLSFRLGELPGSLGKNINEQKALLGREEFTPDPWDLVDAAVAYKEATGKWLSLPRWLRTAVLSSHGLRVDVEFHSDGVYVDDDWLFDRIAFVGLAVARKS